jgi:hypothetical protein
MNESYAKIVQIRSEELNHHNEQPSELVPPNKKELNNKVKLLIDKYTGDGIKDYKNYFKLNSEIIRCKGNVKIISAYINNFNELVIKVKETTIYDEISKPWPLDAFGKGIQQKIKLERYFAALNRVDLELDIEDENVQEFFKKEYNITKAIRIKKKEQKRTNHNSQNRNKL